MFIFIPIKSYHKSSNQTLGSASVALYCYHFISFHHLWAIDDLCTYNGNFFGCWKKMNHEEVIISLHHIILELDFNDWVFCDNFVTIRSV